MKDIFDIKDSLGLKGIVKITDVKTGDVLVNDHNMILKGAKRIILSKLLFKSGDTGFFNNTTLSNNIDGLDGSFLDYSFSKLKLYYNSSEVRYNDNVDIITESEENIHDVTISEENFSIELDDNQMYYILKFNVNILGSEKTGIFNSLSITMDTKEPGEISSEVMFSRIKFDPIVLTTETELNFSYYIYI